MSTAVIEPNIMTDNLIKNKNTSIISNNNNTNTTKNNNSSDEKKSSTKILGGNSKNQQQSKQSSTLDNSVSKQQHDNIAKQIFKLPQEVEEGNIEYKLKLMPPNEERFNQLVSQLKWRIGEGNGEAIYEIGVEDDGTLHGLSQEELEKSIECLKKMAEEIDSEISVLCYRKGKKGKIAQMLVRSINESNRLLDIRVAVCGNVDSGKSTMVGVLTTGKLDNGRGQARLNVFNHKHEIECGRTSSVSEQIMGFNSRGEVVNYSALHNPTWSDIVEESVKVISFFDLAGHEKYLKTTISGMTGQIPDYAMLLVGANMGVTRMTKEHLGLAVALRIPLIVVITKIDMCPPNILRETINSINRILKIRSVKKMPFGVKNAADVVTCIKNISNDRMVPVFRISNVKGDGIDLLRQFLNLLPARIPWKSHQEKHPEVLIDETYFVSGVGTVVGGTVVGGTVKPGQMLLGPDGNGKFRQVQVRSIHTRRNPVKEAFAGQSAGFALKKVKRSTVRKGMVLIHPSAKPKAVYGFEAKIVVLYHSTTISLNYQPVVQCLTIRQSAKIIDMDRKVLRTGDKAFVRFKFLYRPEYLKVGMRLIFREGRCKGIGLVTKIFDSENELIENHQSIADSVTAIKENSTSTLPATSSNTSASSSQSSSSNTNK